MTRIMDLPKGYINQELSLSRRAASVVRQTKRFDFLSEFFATSEK